MNNILEYKGYHATISFDSNDLLFVGEVFGIQDSLNFHGKNVEELIKMFHQCIDNYLELCNAIGKSPDKEFKGSFNVRLSPSLHKEASIAAFKQRKTLNQYVIDAIEAATTGSNAITQVYILQTTPLASATFEKHDAWLDCWKKSNYVLTDQYTHKEGIKC